MATTEVVLLKHIKTLGAEGDQVSVKAGYARNYLFPTGVALPLTAANEKQREALRRRKGVREKQELQQAQELAKKLSNTSLAIVVKTSEAGKMFGAVTVKEICEHLLKNEIDIDRKKIHLSAPIKEIGKHKVSIKLHDLVTFDLPLDIVSENPINT